VVETMADKEHLVVTAIGADRVGIVEKISKFISNCGCNIEDSKMAVFCGEFAVIMLISGDAEGLARVGRDYKVIEDETGLAVGLKKTAARATLEYMLPYRLIASSMDHSGIVYRISAVLSSLGVNIESMETKTYSAPISGTPLFQMEARLSVPAQTNIKKLRETLADIQREENIDIELVAAVYDRR
jgi:glycine cleavage system transcriptional repressor